MDGNGVGGGVRGVGAAAQAGTRSIVVVVVAAQLQLYWFRFVGVVFGAVWFVVVLLAGGSNAVGLFQQGVILLLLLGPKGVLQGLVRT